MLYAIMARDVPDSLARRTSSRDAHLKRLQELKLAGRLVLAGPHPAIDSDDPGPAGFTGSLIVAEFDSLEDALDFAHADPFFTTGAYSDVDVRPFIKVLP